MALKARSTTNDITFADAYTQAHSSAGKRTVGFDPTTQYVSTTGTHAFVAPGSGDARGLCPGLNALVNQLPIKFIAWALTWLPLLSVYGTAVDGDIVSLSFTIGRGQSTILGTENGLTGSHNNYEADVSPTRGDLYEYISSMLLSAVELSSLLRINSFSVLLGIRARNKYPEGRLNRDTLKSFFAITGPHDNLDHTPGHERIPDNRYKRAIGDEYDLPFFFTELSTIAAANPQFASVRGNTGRIDTFTAVNIADLTGGIYNAQTFLQGNNLAYFILQVAMMGTSVAAATILLQQLIAVVSPLFSHYIEIIASTEDGKWMLHAHVAQRFDQKLAMNVLRKAQYHQHSIRSNPEHWTLIEEMSTWHWYLPASIAGSDEATSFFRVIGFSRSSRLEQLFVRQFLRQRASSSSLTYLRFDNGLDNNYNHNVQMSPFIQLYNLQSNVSDPTQNNPYLFNAVISGVAVAPATYRFIFRFMANKSEECPEGRLDRTVLKSSFAVTDLKDNLIYFLSIGGNTGQVNTFTGVDVADLTGGVYNAATLLEGNNFQCFFSLQAATMAMTAVGVLRTGMGMETKMECLTGAKSAIGTTLSDDDERRWTKRIVYKR
ncbi:hypothetical protein EV368DRAFT_69444 [Lentinula lateritia]|nr:hypothetical protein EV368DRAFT_69444 [Lentinula lateritia]